MLFSSIRKIVAFLIIFVLIGTFSYNNIRYPNKILRMKRMIKDKKEEPLIGQQPLDHVTDHRNTSVSKTTHSNSANSLVSAISRRITVNTTSRTVATHPIATAKPATLTSLIHNSSNRNSIGISVFGTNTKESFSRLSISSLMTSAHRINFGSNNTPLVSITSTVHPIVTVLSAATFIRSNQTKNSKNSTSLKASKISILSASSSTSLTMLITSATTLATLPTIKVPPTIATIPTVSISPAVATSLGLTLPTSVISTSPTIPSVSSPAVATSPGLTLPTSVISTPPTIPSVSSPTTGTSQTLLISSVATSPVLTLPTSVISTSPTMPSASSPPTTTLISPTPSVEMQTPTKSRSTLLPDTVLSVSTISSKAITASSSAMTSSVVFATTPTPSIITPKPDFESTSVIIFNITLEDEIFTTELLNQNSKEFQELENRVLNKIKDAFNTYKVSIIKFSKGSVQVTVQMLLLNQTKESKRDRCLGNQTIEMESKLMELFGTTHIGSSNRDCCSWEVIGSSSYKGKYKFKPTLVGDQVNLKCVYNDNIEINRMCLGNMTSEPKWQKLDLSLCPAQEKVTNQLIELSKENCMNCSTSAKTSQKLANIVNNSTLKIPEDVNLIGQILNNIMGTANQTTDYEVKEDISENILDVVDRLIDTNETVLALSEVETRTPTNILTALDKIPDILCISGCNEKPVTISKKNIGLTIKPMQLFDSLKIVAKKGDANGVHIEIDTSATTTKTNEMRGLSQYIFASFLAHKNTFKSTERLVVYSYFYKKSSLFLAKNNLQYHKKKSNTVVDNVLAATVQNYNTTQLQRPITLIFKKTEAMINNVKSSKCSYWRSGTWSQDGCMKIYEDNESIRCSCTHMTNFAILLDVSQTANNPLSLQVITYIGCSISLAGLILTVIAHMTIRTIREKLPSKILTSLSISLICLIVLFLAGVERTKPRIACQIVAGLIQYFMLTSFFWMSVEAVNLYRSLVKVFSRGSSTKFMYIASTIGWGIPAIIVSITGGLNPENLGSSKYCVPIGWSFYLGVLLPVAISLLCNYCLLFITLKSLMNKNVPNAASTSGTEFSYLRRAKITFACATLLGCTWIFGLVAIGDLTDVFQWLFTILNSLQGFFIFVFYTVTNPQIQKAWLNCFTRTGTKKSPSSNMIVKTESTSQVSKIKDVPLSNIQNSNTVSEELVNIADEKEEKEECFEFVEAIFVDHEDGLRISHLQQSLTTSNQDNESLKQLATGDWRQQEVRQNGRQILEKKE